jgi:hypothetical protein
VLLFCVVLPWAKRLPVPPPPAFAEAVIVAPFSPKETPFELLKTTLPRLLEVVPAEKLTGDGAPVGTEMRSSLFEKPTEAMPSPRTERLLASAVPLEVSVVFDEAYQATVWFVCTGTETCTEPLLKPIVAAPSPL